MAFVKLNLAKALEATAGNSLFLDVPKDGDVRVRLLPPDSDNEGSIWYLTENHFRLKAEEGDKGIAVACRKRHAKDDNCLLCDVAKYLENSADAQERKIGKGRESIAANRNWYVQVLPITKEDKVFVAGAPKLLRLPKTGADAVNAILAAQQKNDDAMSSGIEAAQDIVIRRQDTGVPRTTYTAIPTGKPTSLNEYMPGWEEKYMVPAKVWEKIDLKIMSNEEMAAVLTRSYPFLGVPGILKELGYV